MVRWLDDEEQQAWRGLLQLTGALQASMNRQLTEEHGISLSDYDVLARLSEVEGVRVRDLQETLSWEQSRLSHQLSRMEKRGLVVRRACAEDRRGSVISLTAAGRRTVERAAPSHVAHVREVFLDRLSRTQIRQLRALTEKALLRP